MKLATIHFDGGGQSPGPVTAACIVELSDGSFDQDVKRFAGRELLGELAKPRTEGQAISAAGCWLLAAA